METKTNHQRDALKRVVPFNYYYYYDVCVCVFACYYYYYFLEKVAGIFEVQVSASVDMYTDACAYPRLYALHMPGALACDWSFV